ncbi:nitrogen fixation protein NifQ [Telmatospirillum sp. J64-1]|uniref:nitrogen fixation protein NifQ n=1 Tax=Telmatospirillum sp. J64-1 TaxID=2502183 RepID=UPI00115F7144|nr:nitrogen fixation protein NifQ [Telmatospirillum sp. J64-1]
MAAEIYDWLMGCDGMGEGCDRHVFACVLAAALGDPARSPCEACGLPPETLCTMIHHFFPAAWPSIAAIGVGEAGELAPEEEDLRRLLTANGTCGRREEAWLAVIIARRSLWPNHLWQDLGLRERAELTALMARHFRPMAEANSVNMKWKKFFYRQMCAAEGMTICKSPNCEICDDFSVCFGPEEGEPLAKFPAEGA